ncbi:MAG TPA: hypothetical protein VFB50_17610 [Chloroflexota bacterium]|nr:hypothetical protein [Chloroflexota bacterium]
MSQISVSYDRKFSDGNYGSEGLAMSWTGESDDEVRPDIGQIDELLVLLRRLVLEQLARSQAERVRWAAYRELQGPHPKPDDKLAVTVPEDVSLEDLPF